MDQELWTAESVRDVLSDPAYCLLEPPVISEETWIQAGVRLINEMGQRHTSACCLTTSGRSEWE
jgi:hypothetical protein